MAEAWDLVVVGAGPAGSSAALGALAARPGLSVLLLDRSDFPRDKACGDGIAPHVLDVLAAVGVTGLLDDRVPVRTLRLRHGLGAAERQMARPAWVVPRAVFDQRLVEAAVRAGAVLRRHRVRVVALDAEGATVDGMLRAQVVVGADGANSLLRTTAGLAPVRRRALALRGYAPTRKDLVGEQVIAFGQARGLSYAWSFDRGDGLANVGYGELLDAGGHSPPRQLLIERLEVLLPGSTDGATDWLGHHLPLSSRVCRQPAGRVLLAGDAAGLVNPMSGEGIFYAVATGVAAGRSAATALGSDDGGGAGAGAGAGAADLYRRAVTSLLGRHLRHTAVASRLMSLPAVAPAGVRAAAADQRVFDDLVEIGLGRGLVTRRLAFGLLVGLSRRRRSGAGAR